MTQVTIAVINNQLVVFQGSAEGLQPNLQQLGLTASEIIPAISVPLLSDTLIKAFHYILQCGFTSEAMIAFIDELDNAGVPNSGHVGKEAFQGAVTLYAALCPVEYTQYLVNQVHQYRENHGNDKLTLIRVLREEYRPMGLVEASDIVETALSQI